MPWRWAFHDLFHSLFLPTSQYNRPRRYFMLEMNHRTKGDCKSRNSINDHSVTGWKRGSYFMFKLLSPTRGSSQLWGWKSNAILRHLKKQTWFSHNQWLISDSGAPVCSQAVTSFPNVQAQKQEAQRALRLCFKELHTQKIKSHHCHRAWAACRILQDLWDKSR